MLARLPIRLRLAAGFAAGLAVVLILAGAFVYIKVADNLSGALDANLSARAGDMQRLVEGSGSTGANLGGLRGDSDDDAFAQVLGTGGSLVESTLPGHTVILTRSQAAAAAKDELTLDEVQINGIDGTFRVTALPATGSNGNEIVVVGATTSDMEETLSGLRRAFTIGAPLALLLASMIGYLLGSRALRPVEAMRLRAEEITLDHAGERLPVPVADDELRSLADTLNEMLGRVETALQRERVFVSDASHELRTPLAILKSEIELIRRTGGSRSELEAVLESAGEEIDHLILLSENLLVIARTDRGSLSLKLETVDVNTLLERVASRFAGPANAAGRTIGVEPGGAGGYPLDQLRLEQAVGNLVDNALAHGAGQITLGASRDAQALIIYVRDEGPGFPVAFQDQAFERFSQAESGRTETGTGLGLAIVKAIALAHGGWVEIHQTGQGGAEVRLGFPPAES